MKRIFPVLLFLALVAMLGDLGFSQENYKTYVVQKGETWSKLAIKLDIPMRELAEFNGQAIEDIIYAGQGIKIPLVENTVTVTVIDEKVSKSWNFWVSVVPSVIVILILLGLIITYILKHRKKREEIGLKIEGIEYIYRPQVDSQGRFVSLYNNGTGSYSAFAKIVDLRRSLKASFKKNPSLIEQEIKAGRLIRKS